MFAELYTAVLGVPFSETSVVLLTNSLFVSMLDDDVHEIILQQYKLELDMKVDELTATHQEQHTHKHKNTKTRNTIS